VNEWVYPGQVMQTAADVRDATSQLEAELVPLLATARGVLRRLAPHVHPELDVEGLRMLLCVDRFVEQSGRGVRGAELVESLGIHKSSVSRGVGQLEQLGLLTRTPDQRDARASLLQLSQHGAACLAAGRRHRHDEIAAALSSWKEEEIEQAAILLRRLIADLG
jgi:DNA-binding MarR family transcriptional regulator